jgi:hypothetical protein
VPDAASRRPVAASHGVAWRFRDSNPEVQDGYWFRPTRATFETPCGFSTSEPHLDPKTRAGPSCAFVLLRRRVIAAPHRSVTIQPEGWRATRPAMLPLLGFRALRHISVRWIRLIDGDGSLRRRVPRPGFGYPHRDFHHRSYRRVKRRSVHGLHPSRSSPRARAVLLSESVPS